MNEPLKKPRFFATRGHLMLCHNTSCRQKGADLLHLALTRHLEQEHLMYYKSGGSVRYTLSGCLGACSHGPVMACYRQTAQGLEQGWYFGMTLPLALQVARSIQQQTPLPGEHRFDL
ncbi:(2Fe-2S) ferredoxin domain-containing protein [Deinococcus roseus]|uniref:Ferredoxin n=1 Tax=Deinococcus roseus TaxID=392414 RepID=A0ABQ2D1G0_9DEIO|nr:NAD(P)H-dependent oxidoreductase subunit E [Deinococcus roseus]GGJ41422.1 ferredoxin [Deinococcus roseus]